MECYTEMKKNTYGYTQDVWISVHHKHDFDKGNKYKKIVISDYTYITKNRTKNRILRTLRAVEGDTKNCLKFWSPGNILFIDPDLYGCV